MTGETKKLLIIIIAIVVIVNLPVLYGYLITPEGHTFTGIRSLVPGDMLVYYSYIEQVKEGSIFFEDRFTTEIGIPVFNVFWFSTGFLARIFYLSPIETIIVFRVFLSLLFLYTLFKMVGYFQQYNSDAIRTFFFMILSSGFGIYYIIFNPPTLYRTAPLDIGVSEFNPLLIISSSPHFILSALLILLIFFFAYRAQRQHSFFHAILSGLLALVLFQYLPYYIPLIYGVLSIYYLVSYIYNRGKPNILYAFDTLLLIGLISSPSVIYHLFLISNDVIYIYRALDNILPLPYLPILLLSYGAITPLAIMGLVRIVREKRFTDKNIFLLTWLFVQGILVFIPLIGYQTKLLLGMFFPLYIFAYEGACITIRFIATKFRFDKVKFQLVIIISAALFLFPSTFYNLARDYMIYTNPSKELFQLFYISPDRKEAYEWIKMNVLKDEAILSTGYSGTMITGFTARRVYYGHDSETIFYKEVKIPLVTSFFSDRVTNEWRENFLIKEGISYLWWGDAEREMTNTFSPFKVHYLRPVFINDEVTIFKLLQQNNDTK